MLSAENFFNRKSKNLKFLLHMPFTARINVRFGDCDPAGLVYYPVLFHYCYAAMEEFFSVRCGVTYARLAAEERLRFPTVNVRAPAEGAKRRVKIFQTLPSASPRPA